MLRVLTGEGELARVGVAPGCGIVLIDQKLSAEVKDVFAADHGHDVGRVPGEFLIDRVGSWRDPRKGILPAGSDDPREIICLGELPTQLAGVAFIEGEVRKEVQLAGKTYSRFVDGAWADVPYVGDLCVVIVHVTGLTSDGAGEYGARVDYRSIALSIRHSHAISRRDVVIQAAEVLPVWRGLHDAGEVVVFRLPFRTDISRKKRRAADMVCRRREESLHL